jgi:uracil-DNA glycosylase
MLAEASSDQLFAITLDAPDDFDGWRDAARALVAARVDPSRVSWSVAGDTIDLFGAAADALPPYAPVTQPFSVAKAFLPLAGTALLHRDPERFALLHRLLDGLVNRTIALDDGTHPLIARIEAFAKAVRRDVHKMRAFLRFRAVDAGDGSAPRYVAWFEPDHHIVRHNATFFIDRFAAMHWSILTPQIAIHWDGERLAEGPGAVRGDAPDDDPVEDAWKRYYASIFNPSRLKVGAMLKEMPRKYWANMPETALVAGLIAGAQARSAAMIAAGAGATAGSAVARPKRSSIAHSDLI